MMIFGIVDERKGSISVGKEYGVLANLRDVGEFQV